MKKILVLVCASLAIVMLSACGSKKSNSKKVTTTQVKQEISFNLGAEPKTLDPQLNTGIPGAIVIDNMYEGLTRENKNGKFMPAGATSWKISKDNLTYTFKLRKDAKWSDGKSVTASDYKYAWLRGVDPKVASGYSYQFFYIKGAKAYFDKKGTKADVGIKVIDKYTLEVTLQKPTAYFLGLTASAPYMPVRADMVAKNPDTWSQNPKENVSDGPFMMKEYKMNSTIGLVPNPYYWNKKNIKLKNLDFKMLTDSSTALVAYDNNKISVVMDLPVQDIVKRKIEDPTFHVLPMLGIYYYDFNTKVKPLNKLDVRKALSLSIDREQIVKNITRASQIPASGFVPFGISNSSGKDFRKSIGDYGVSKNAKVKKAQALLAKAGYPDGKGFPNLTISYNTSLGHKAVAEAIQAMWKKNLGINVKLQNQEWAVFLSKRVHGDFQIARDGWVADYSDPMTFLDLFTSYSTYNYVDWKPYNGKHPDSKIFNTLISEAKNLKASPKRDEDMAKAEKILHDSYVSMPIYYYTQPALVKANIRDWTCNSFGVWYFGNSYIEAKK